MANTITGRIYGISPVMSIPSKNGGQPFLKREIIIDATRYDPYTGERDKYDNYPCVEFSGDKCKELDAYGVGDVVTISFVLQGSFFDGQDGKRKNFTSVRGYKIEAVGKSVANIQHQPQQVQQPQQQVQQPIYSSAPPPGKDDLPW